MWSYWLSYVSLLVTALVILYISSLNEYKNVSALKSTPSPKNYYYIYLVRYVHYIFYLFCVFYLIFFLGIGEEMDQYLYLFLLLGLVVGWYIFDCCSLSFLELFLYNLNTDKLPTTLHPSFYPIFYPYTDLTIVLIGVGPLITLPIILYYITSLNAAVKVLYCAIFVAFFIQAYMKSRVNVSFYNSSGNQYLKWLKETVTGL